MWVVWKKAMVMMVDDSINQICPMYEDGGRIHLTQILGMQPYTISMGNTHNALCMDLSTIIRSHPKCLLQCNGNNVFCMMQTRLNILSLLRGIILWML